MARRVRKTPENIWDLIRRGYEAKAIPLQEQMESQLRNGVLEINKWHTDDEYQAERVKHAIGHTDEWILRIYGLCSQIWSDLGREKDSRI